MGAEIVNLRRARKTRARGKKEREAEANRVKHGVSKDAQSLARARNAKQRREIESHKLDDGK